jgi:hypothetical protein
MGFFLSILLAFSLFVRGFSISSLPPELFGDEVDAGYQAYSLLHTGRDLYGQLLPTYIHSLSEWRTPLLMYYTVPTIYLFGNTEWGVRAPEVILGALAPLILFLLVYEVSRSKSISLLTSVILAIMPWHILYSRAAFETVILLDFVMLGTLFFVKKKYFTAFLFLFLTPYIYSTASVFVPLWLVCLWLIYKPKFRISYLVSLVLLIPFALSLFSGHAAERFGKVGLFDNPEITDAITILRQESTAPWERVFSNKGVFILDKIYTNYLSAFSPEFLFIRGDPTARQSLQYIGQLFPYWAPFLVLGLIYLIKQKKYFWLTWLLLAPIPSALTYDGAYHATRLFMMIPPLAVAVACGIYWPVSQLKKPWAVPLYALIWVAFTFQFAAAANYYFNHYPQKTWIWWHVGFKDAMTEVAKLSPQYHKIFMNNTYEPALIRFLFYSKYDPHEFQKNFTLDQPMADVYPGYYGFYLAPKYYFGDFSIPKNKSIVDMLEPGNLYVISQRDDLPGAWDWRKTPPGGVKVIYTSVNPLGNPIFYLVVKS